MTTGFGVRRGVPADLPAWQAVFEAVAAEGMWIGSQAPVAWTPERVAGFEAGLAGDDAGGVAYLATAGDEVVGWISLHPTPHHVSFWMGLAAVARGQGLGGRLLDAGLEWAAGVAAVKVACEVWPHNTAALRLYLSRGFTVEGRRRRHWRRDDGRRWDSVLMGLVLDGSAPGSPHEDSPLLAGTVAEVSG